MRYFYWMWFGIGTLVPYDYFIVILLRYFKYATVFTITVNYICNVFLS